MKKALRMGYNSYAKEEIFARNLALVSRNADAIDEITLFTEPCHQGYWTVEFAKETSEILKDRIKRYKEAGVARVGLNVLCTIGHTEDGNTLAPKAELQYMTTLDGEVSGSCLCPSDDRFYPYIKERYALYCQTGADFLWLDDDIRIDNHGVMRNYCFCPECVKKFNARFGTEYSQKEVRELFKTDPFFKGKWHESIYATFTQLFRFLHDVIKETAPNMEVGFMSGWPSANTDWIEACGATMGRPGGGFYNDLSPIDMFAKHFDMQMCVRNYPERVKDIQYEYESYNFLSLQKSVYISELESSLMITAGCNGMLYNRWTHTDEFIDMMRKSAKKWDVFSSANEGCRPVGIYCHSSAMARCLMEIGLPVTAYPDAAVAFFITGAQLGAYSAKRVSHMLDTGLYTDGEGLTVLEKMGFDDLGGKVTRRFENGVYEHFTEDPLNTDYCIGDSERFVSLDIYRESEAFEIEPDAAARVLSTLNSNYVGMQGCCNYVYLRKNGRHIAIDGCLMPSQIQTANKKAQMTGVFELITDKKLPVVIDKLHAKVIPVVTEGETKVNAVLVNAHFDPTGAFEVKMRTGKNFKRISRDGKLIPVTQRSENGETVISVENLGAWDYLLLTGEK